MSKVWSKKEWNRAMTSLNERKNRTEESIEQLNKMTEIDIPQNEDLKRLVRKIALEDGHAKIPLTTSKLLRDDALILLKSFLPPEHNDLEKNDAFLIKGNNVERRLYTYTKIYQTIKDKNLNHIRLPLKFLVLKDKKTDTYITDPKKIKPILSKKIKAFVSTQTMLRLSFLLDALDDDYNFCIFAEKIASHKSLSLAAFQELEVLVEDAPFDVGWDNIFADEHGDAVVIDTRVQGNTVS